MQLLLHLGTMVMLNPLKAAQPIWATNPGLVVATKMVQEV